MEAAGESFFRKIQKAFEEAQNKGFVHLKADAESNLIHDEIWKTIVNSNRCATVLSRMSVK